MVRSTSSLLLYLAAVSSLLSGIPTAAAAIPVYDVPSFDYTNLHDLHTPSRVLTAFENGGILALRNIPNYVAVRENYLTRAVECALAMESDGHSAHLSNKQFADGTRRLTLRSSAGRELDQLTESPVLAVKCPGYHDAYRAFSRTLERAVDSFAASLDATSFRLSDGVNVLTSRSLFRDAERLDHFHAYEAATSATSSESGSESDSESMSTRELSLSLHEDHGMFIAMAAPAFFDVDANGRVTRRQLTVDADSGLVIRHSINGTATIVRPLLKSDELVVMAGTGFTQWLEATHAIPAVMHGMRMPQELVVASQRTPEHRHLRAWFGKMTLLPLHQRMLRNGGIAFDKFTNMTTRHLRSDTNAAGENEELKTVGCASGRKLVVSEGSCVFRQCKPRPGYVGSIFPSCATRCNYEYPSQSQVDSCNLKCECTGTTTNAGMCWMTCAAWLSVNT